MTNSRIFCLAIYFVFSSFVFAHKSDDLNPAFTIDGKPWFILSNNNCLNNKITAFGLLNTEKPKQIIKIVNTKKTENLISDLTEYQKVDKLVVNEDDWSEIEQTLAYKKYNNSEQLPDLVIITAKFDSLHEDRQIVFILEAKPTCQTCLISALSWAEKLKNSYINDDESALIYETENIALPIQNMHRANFNIDTEESCFFSATNWLYSNAYWISATSGGIIFYYGKMILSAMGFMHCPKTGGTCCCKID